jgi:predicted nucleotidyltransferase
MSSISPSTLRVHDQRPVHPVTIALLGHVRDATRRLNTEFVVAGATARDIVLWHVYGIQAERATRDVDVAVCAITWDAYRHLVVELEATGLFKADPKAQQSLLFSDPDVAKPVPLDIVPFGPLEAPAGSIVWPPNGDFVMNVLGFREAVDTSIDINIGDVLLVPVVALPALALLKILAWRDRRTRKNTDSTDLLLILRSYHSAGNSERIWEIGADLLEVHEFDVDLAATALLGWDARQAALPATVGAISALLEDASTYETLRRDMVARAAVQTLDGFVDGAEEALAAFRGGFIGSDG